MDIKVLLQVLNGVWLIEESAANEYAVIAHQLKAGNVVKLEAKATPAYMMPVAGSVGRTGNVLVLPINGPIMKYDFCGSMGTQTMANIIRSANASSTVDAIVLSIDSPGGAVDGTEDLSNAIAASTKPVIAFAHGKMASAAYWIGSAAKEIIISGETTMLGSIGTMATLRKGINADEQVLFASKSTRKNKAVLDAMNGETEAFIKSVLDPINVVFTKAVEKYRAGKIDLKTEDVTEGDIYYGKKAIAVGLADKIGTLDYAVKRAYSLSKNLSK